ncbi:MAG: PqqD family protein [Longimicrobiales bacterium]
MMLRRNPAVLFQPVGEGAILLHTQQEVYFGLNEVGAQVWQLLSVAGTDLTAVVDELSRRYPEVEPELLRADVRELVEGLAREGLLQLAAAA